ncbi:MAG TPA: SdpI family protein, partial [archaeon]|nr:SdpI family protein [archaeon]
ATSALLITLGIILMKLKKRNLFFGIRTPWTIVDDDVWIKTHKLGGWLFIIIGITTLFALLYIKYFTIIFFTEIILLLFVTFIYSYLLYKKNRN